MFGQRLETRESMKALRKLLGYDDKFFDLLEASAKEAQSSVQLLATLVKSPDTVPTLDDFIQARRKDKRITEEITEALCKTFVTPLEREDIEALSFALYKIPKTVEKFSEKFVLCNAQVRNVDFQEQLRILEKGVATLVVMVQNLRTRTHLEKMKELNDQLHYLEGQADKLMLQFVRDLYSGHHEPIKVIITLDLYETLEGVIDRCRDAGNVIFQIVLKYS
jgi:uncharacterized protein Yka (UPF0111/DUF47 family)